MSHLRRQVKEKHISFRFLSPVSKDIPRSASGIESSAQPSPPGHWLVFISLIALPTAIPMLRIHTNERNKTIRAVIKAIDRANISNIE